MAILAVNAGSSTLKFSIHPREGGRVLPSVLSGNIQGLEPGGNAEVTWTTQGQFHREALDTTGGDSFGKALVRLGELLAIQEGLPVIEAVAHRVVHGGQDYATSVVVTDEVLERLARLNSLAPLHQPHNLQGIRAFAKAFAHLPQVACFDTAFHTTLPEMDYRFALPAALTEQGVRRYGFHGLSYQYIMGTLLERSPRAKGRVLMAHLGNGASLCGALAGQSRATSMGFSALDGLMMGTRTGALDAGVLLYLMEQGWDHDRLQTLLYKQSGLLGVSGISADMRRLRADTSASAQLAVAMFTHRVVRESGAMVACLQGLDVLAFSGGIGEHDVQTRADVCARMAWMGVRLDADANARATGTETLAIHAADSTVEVWVVPTDEGSVAAQDTVNLLFI